MVLGNGAMWVIPAGDKVLLFVPLSSAHSKGLLGPRGLRAGCLGGRASPTRPNRNLVRASVFPAIWRPGPRDRRCRKSHRGGLLAFAVRSICGLRGLSVVHERRA
jgi:hypothetical protein